MYETDVEEGVLRFSRPGTRWLSTSWHGGFVDADAAFNVTVPEGFDRTDLAAYARERRHRAGFDLDGPTLLTGVAMRHARGARSGPLECVATAGVSNPATLAMEVEGGTEGGAEGGADGENTGAPTVDSDEPPTPGTVNVLVGTNRALDDGTLTTLLATVVEAKTATLLATTGFTGTTTDAVVVGSDPGGDPSPFAGSGTQIGSHARACVREAVGASLDARYADADLPTSVSDAEHGTSTTVRASVYDPRD